MHMQVYYSFWLLFMFYYSLHYYSVIYYVKITCSDVSMYLVTDPTFWLWKYSLAIWFRNKWLRRRRMMASRSSVSYLVGWGVAYVSISQSINLFSQLCNNKK